MGFVSGIDDFVFPPRQAFRFGSLDFITNDFGKISLLDSDPNQSGRGQVSAPYAPPASILYRRRSSSTMTSATTTTTATSTTSTKATKTTTRLSSLAFSWPTTRRKSNIKPEKQKNNAYNKKPSIADWRRSVKYRSKNGCSDYHQPSLSVASAGSSRRSRDHSERSVHSPPDRHRERQAEQPRSPRRRRPVDLRDTINQRRAARGYIPHHSPDHYDDDVDGVAAFTSDLRRVDWPAGFKPTGIEKYDGTINPESWLTVYDLVIRAAGGDSKAMANYLPVALVDFARSRLHGLPRGTIGSWAELCGHFIANFQGTFERPGTQFDLYNVIQKSGESLRNYIRRFSEQRNKISDITEDVIIAAFTKGIRHELLVGKFGRKPPKTSGSTWKPKKDTPTTGGSGSANHKDRKHKPEELVATTTPSSRQHSRVNTFDKIMNSQYPHHPNSNHAAKDCFIYKQFAEQYANNTRKPTYGDQSTSKKKDDEDDAPTGFQDPRKELNHIFGGPLAYESKRKQKLTEREINAVQPDTPQYLRWSETAIKFDRSDNPDRVVHPGRYPLVLDPVVHNVKLRRSLIDGGSTLNILFAKTLDNMQIPRTELKPSTFHAILARPALAKFMAVPHYTHMMMKMPGPRGVISLRSDIKQAVTCDKESCEMAQIREITLAREEIRLAASTATEGEVPATKTSKSGEGNAKTKKIPLDPSDPTKTTVIGTELDCK
uniref:OSJNBa0039G19.13 protein n=1 Tax=Oryza sativa subsp. japonica TaxID=39947 RepID=Q7XXD6_ORYSJ|nr:OSJNBa0039G19.13 [Oryza sativa Japonica Group]